MITLNSANYDVTFVGNVEIQEMPGAQLSVDVYGLDTVVRPYKGGIHKLPAFLAALNKNPKRSDTLFPGLALASYTATQAGPWAEASLTFKGTYDGRIPPMPEPSTSLSTETVTLTQYDGEEGESVPSVEITYYAPVTTYRYVSRTRPIVPRFRGALEGLTEVQILKRRGAQGALKIFTGGSLGTPQLQVGLQELGSFNGVAITATKVFNVEPAGIYFEVEEQNMRTIVPFEIANINWSMTV